MVTLITWHTSGGDSGRCDAKCYEAQEPDCQCICGGRNHGKGLQQATDNTRELAESWMEAARARGQDVTSIELAMDAACNPLFSLEESNA